MTGGIIRESFHPTPNIGDRQEDTGNLQGTDWAFNLRKGQLEIKIEMAGPTDMINQKYRSEEMSTFLQDCGPSEDSRN